MSGAVESSGQERLWLWLIVLAGFVLRAAAVLVLHIEPESDYLAYQTMALNFIDGRGIVDSMGNKAMYNVGYPLLLLAPVFFVFGKSLIAVQFVHACLGALSIWLIHRIAKQAGARSVPRLLAAAFFAIYLPAAVYSEYLAKENLMIPIMLGICLYSLRLLKRATVRDAAGCGLLYGLIALTGNAGVALGLATLAAFIISSSTWSDRLRFAVVAGLVAAVVVAPWMTRNAIVLGAPVLNTNGGFNLYLGNNPAADGFFVSIADTPRGPTWQTLRSEGEVHASAVLREEAFAWIVEDPSRFAELATKKAMLFWMPPTHEGKGTPSRMESLIRQIWLLQFIVLVAAAVLGLAVRSLHTAEVAILWFAVVGYTAIHMLFYVIYRYREPIIPIVCILAAMSVGPLAERIRRPG